jgi:hypothetical protein
VRPILPGGRWHLAPDPLVAQLRQAAAPSPDQQHLIAHRQLRTMNSQLRNLTTTGVLVHPTMIAGLGGDGAEVEVRSAHGATRGPVRGDERVPPGAVAIPHGWDGPDVSALTSADQDVDPLTGMVRQSALPVEVRVVGAR